MSKLCYVAISYKIQLCTNLLFNSSIHEVEFNPNQSKMSLNTETWLGITMLIDKDDNFDS